MLATALCLDETQVKSMTWTHYKALCEHWVKSPPAQMTLAVWLKSRTR